MYQINHVVHKDAHPIDTVKRIQNILDNIGLEEKNRRLVWYSFGDGSHSCSLLFRNCPMLKSNGKGLNKELALASAYGEFMERLQCFGQHSRFNRIGLFPPPPSLASNIAQVDKQQLVTDVPQIMKSFDHVFEQLPQKLNCIPFADLFGQKMVMVSPELLTALLGSNGMCAGNSMEEALTQGISEIFERYVLAMLHEGKMEGLPTIQIEKGELAAQKLWDLLDELETREYQVIVKDASLGGVFPVVAVIIENKEGTKIDVSFGSDPDFQIAVQRCITELFQGKTDLIVEKEFLQTKTYEQMGIGVANNPHLLYPKLIASVGEDKHQDAFVDICDSRGYLKHQQDLIRSLNKKIFIHDYSILGFPAYQIFIEDLSCINPVAMMPSYYLDEKDSMLETVLTLPQRTPAELKAFRKKIARLMHSPYRNFDSQFRLLFGRVPVATLMDADLLTALLCIEENDYAAALSDLGYFCPHEEERELKQILVDYCNLQLASGMDSNQLNRELSQKYAETRYAPSLHHLIAKNYGSFLSCNQSTGDGQKFSNLPLPKCMDESCCNDCYLSLRCRKEGWYDVREKIRVQLVEPEQADLLLMYKT